MLRIVRYTTEKQRNILIKPPLCVFNGFPETTEGQLIKEMFRNMFPRVDISEQREIDRIILVNYAEKPEANPGEEG